MEKKDKKISKIFLWILFVLKIIFGIFIAVVVVLVIDFFVSDHGWHSVVTEIYEGCYIEDFDDNMQSIYYYPDGDEAKERKYIVEEWEDIVKYASNGKDIVAFHCIYDNSTYEDKFVIFNTSEEKQVAFDTQKDFADFCKEENIILSEWKRGDRKPCKIINLGGDWTLYDFDDNFTTDQILNVYEVVYEGHVSDVTEDKNGIVNFRLIVPYYNDFEFSSSNGNLEVKEEVISELKCEAFTTMEICYDEILMLDTKTGAVTVKGE